MRRLTLCVVAAVAAMAVPSAALAGGGPPVVFTEVSAGAFTGPFVGCDGTPGLVTVDFRNTFHITQFDSGRVSVTQNGRGTFFFVPAEGPTSTGHYASNFHVTFTGKTQATTSVFVGAGVFENGDRFNFQVRSHLTYANGEVRSVIDSVSCA